MGFKCCRCAAASQLLRIKEVLLLCRIWGTSTKSTIITPSNANLTRSTVVLSLPLPPLRFTLPFSHDLHKISVILPRIHCVLRPLANSSSSSTTCRVLNSDIQQHWSLRRKRERNSKEIDQKG